MTIVIGLCGGIASGKSTVATTLEELGAQTVNADLVGHKVYAPGTPCFVEIVRHFGSGIVGASGEIDRKALGQIVFHDTKQMHALNRIVWPAIRAELAQHIEQARAEGAPVLVIEAAVLIEAQWQDMVDEVWVTYVDPDVACTRLIARHSMSKKHAMQRIHSQIPNAERLQHADVAIDNNGSMEELRQQTRQYWSKLLQRVHARQERDERGVRRVAALLVAVAVGVAAVECVRRLRAAK